MFIVARLLKLIELDAVRRGSARPGGQVAIVTLGA